MIGKDGPPRGGGGRNPGGRPGRHPVYPTGTRAACPQPRRRESRDEGAQAALDAAHTSARIAGEEAIRRLALSGREFTAEDVREIVGAPLGCSPSVMGALFNAARMRGEIRAVGFTTSSRPERHAGVCRVWVGVG